ncbi:hypothetical protein LQE93_09590 [Clostridium sp. NSJ-145]|uniref:hypothetical protein n=1 Tax=Clostridium sp. NSJ-145 TaxID=2897777 RepID=UPI001E41E09E|nr:hypothetical protein [Clostridium sp. NSJ-145]MCD2502031.1 hypothetical protein [Clostridium sp. NSJ-145]
MRDKIKFSGDTSCIFYWCEINCYVSGKLLGVNQFSQIGVENYKKRVFERLGK